MPASSTGMCRSVRRRTISSSAGRVTAGSMPRSMSLAPSSTMTASVPSGTDQSSRASPPDAVSPETPGIGDLDRKPLWLQRPLQPGRESGARGQAEAGGERIAERHDPSTAVGSDGACRPSLPTGKPASIDAATAKVWTNTIELPYERTEPRPSASGTALATDRT